MKDWYGTEESFDAVKTYEELQEKVSSLEGCVNVKWDD